MKFKQSLNIKPERKGLAIIAAGILILVIGVPQMRLVGVHNNSLVIIEDSANKRQDVFELGKEIFSKATLVAIEADKAIVEYKGQRYTLNLKQAISLSGGEETIDFVNRFEVSETLRKFPREIFLSNTLPVVENGEIIGFSVSNIEANSLLSSWGVKSGDVITSINGRTVRGAFDAMDVVARAKSTDFQIEIKRNGKPEVLKFSEV